MKQLKIIIAICLFVLCISVANAVYEPMGDVVEVEEESTDAFVYPTETIWKVSEVLGNRWTLAEAIVIWCMNHSEDLNLCIEQVFWVANAESSLFKNVSSSNNWFWWMQNWTLKRFSSVEEWIVQWIRLREKNGWSVRVSGEQRMKWHYCVSGCSYWITNYNDWIAKVRANLY